MRVQVRGVVSRGIYSISGSSALIIFGCGSQPYFGFWNYIYSNASTVCLPLVETSAKKLMAAFEHATMPETDVEENRTLLRKADGMKHPLHILVTNQTPMPYAKPPLSCKVKKSASTPDAFFETPATVAVTPEDFDSLGSVHKQFCITEKNLDASSTEAASSKSSVESDTFRFGREPSPQQRGRALFSLEVVDDLDDDSEAEIEILNIGRGLRRAYSDLGCPLHHTLSLHINSAGPPVPKAHCGCQYEDSRRMIRSRRPSNHQVETFPSSCDHSAALHFHDCPIPVVVKLRDDEQQAYILGNDCSTYVTEQDGTQGPIRRRRRRRSDSSWLRLSRRLATTKHMVWLLSLVGLTWVCVIITANHRISQGDIEQNDHISVLFRRALHDQRGFALPPPTSTLRGLTQPGNKTHHRAVNLHTLAQVHDDEQTIVKSTSKVTKQQHPSGKPRHKEATTRMDRRSRSSYNHVNNADHRRRGSGHLPHHSHALHFIEDHQQHHQNHLKPINEYVKAKPGISGTSAVTGVIYPNDLIVRIEPVFTSIDRNLYSQGLGTADESGRPRIVTLDSFSSEIVQSTHMSVQQYPADFTDSTQLYSIYDSGDERISTMEMRAPFMKDECVPMQEWQTTFNPFCNGMHELDMAGIGDNRNEDDFKLFGMNGFWRNAWRYDSTSGHTDLSERDTVVLKTLR